MNILLSDVEIISLEGDSMTVKIEQRNLEDNSHIPELILRLLVSLGDLTFKLCKETTCFYTDEKDVSLEDRLKAASPENRLVDVVLQPNDQGDLLCLGFKFSDEKPIDFSSFSNMVESLTKDGQDIIDDLTPEGADLLHVTSAAMGEAGELFDAVKKHTIYNKPLDRENMIEELGDLEFYLERVRQILSISREETIQHNMRKLGQRYSSGTYSDKQAQERADKTNQ